jgi:hypothetical protein
MPGPPKPSVAFGIDRVGATSSLMSMRRARQRGNERCRALLSCLLHNADSMWSALLATQGASEGKWCARARRRAEMHTRQWVGAYGGRGNGDYRAELASVLQAITTYLKHFALSPQVALVRLDGQYGDAAVIAQLTEAGVSLVTRGRGYQILEHPQLQRVLAHPPTARVTASTTGEIIDLFEGGWLELGAGLPQARVIVARHPAPAEGKKVTVGKRVGEWVYELFITTLSADGFLVEDVLDLYHGRGAFEVVLEDGGCGVLTYFCSTPDPEVASRQGSNTLSR